MMTLQDLEREMVNAKSAAERAGTEHYITRSAATKAALWHAQSDYYVARSAFTAEEARLAKAIDVAIYVWGIISTIGVLFYVLVWRPW